MKKLLIALAALAVLCSCSEKKATIPLYGWEGIGKNPNLEEVRAKFQNYKAHGFTGVCIQADLADIPAISAIAHEEGLEYHAWKPCMLQGGKPHEWYAVNRLGQSADEFPAYVQYYQALDPANPEVQDFIVSMITETMSSWTTSATPTPSWPAACGTSTAWTSPTARIRRRITATATAA